MQCIINILYGINSIAGKYCVMLLNIYVCMCITYKDVIILMETAFINKRMDVKSV